MTMYLLVAGIGLALAAGVFLIVQITGKKTTGEGPSPQDQAGLETWAQEKARLLAENRRLSTALEREIQSRGDASEDLRKQMAFQEQEIKRLRQSNEMLTAENHDLKKAILQKAEQARAFWNEVHAARDELAEVFGNQRRQIRSLSEQLRRSQDEALGKTLEKDLQHWKDQCAQQEQQAARYRRRALDVEDRLRRYEKEVEARMAEMRQTIIRLSEQKDAPQDASSRQGVNRDAMAALIRRLRRERFAFLREKIALEMDCSRVKELNERMRAKERDLQYELIKVRAQALGLEKMCEGFKERIEAMNGQEAVTCV